MSLTHTFPVVAVSYGSPRYFVLLGTNLPPGWCVLDANCVPRSLWKRGIVALRNVLSAIPTQLGRTDPLCVPQQIPTLRFVSVSRWFRQARKPLLTACGRMAKSARRCSLRPSCRFCQACDGTMCSKTPEAPLPFAATRCGGLHCFSFMCPCLPSR